MFLSSRYKDDEKDIVILRSYEKEYKETRKIFDQEVAKIELVKEVIMLPVTVIFRPVGSNYRLGGGGGGGGHT